MKNDSPLISTSILTAIWEETRKDNIELITPFLKYLIYKNFKIKDIIDKELLINKMQKEFSFNKFPHAILDIILERMTKKKILKRENKQFHLIKDLKDDYELFISRLNNAKNHTHSAITDLYEYLKVNSFPKITKDETEMALANFIDSHGYNTYQNLLTTKNINSNKEFLNYCIGEYIFNESKKESDKFDKILKIIEGYMIANAIYMQIENDNKASLRNLTCYLDGPFLLRVLGYKTEEENLSALELFELLKKYNANICCFEHNFQEVKNILIFYKNHIGTFQENTLEYFDLKKYSESQVEMVINSLEDRFKELKIKICEAPDYTEDKYKDVIDERLLEEKLKEHSKNKKNLYNNENAIKNDVRSVCSINMMRKGKTTKKLENCNCIFVTTYYYLKRATKEVMQEINDLEIGLVIDDLDLTTFLWFKDFSKNDDLPKLRLVENALAAIDPNPQIIEKANKYLEDIKRDGLIKNLGEVSQFFSTTYLKFTNDYIKEIENNPENVTQENIEDFLIKKDKQIKDMQNELENTKDRNIKNKIQLENIKQKIYDEAENNIKTKCARFNKVTNSIVFIIIGIIFIICLYCSIESYLTSKLSFKTIISLIFIVIGVFDALLPRAKFVKKLMGKISDKYRRYITNIENNKANRLACEELNTAN